MMVSPARAARSQASRRRDASSMAPSYRRGGARTKRPRSSPRDMRHSSPPAVWHSRSRRASLAKPRDAATVAQLIPIQEPRLMLDVSFAKPALPKSGALVLLVEEGGGPGGATGELWRAADEATGGAVSR